MRNAGFSIGRVQQKDIKHYKENSISQDKLKIITGFLLRSQVVSGWPDLQIEGFNEEKNKLKLLRGDRLSTDVMICLFEGVTQQVDISLKPEGLHFGFDVDKSNKNQLHLELRDQEEKLLIGDENIIQMNEKFYKGKDIEKRVINVQELSSTINNKVPAKDDNFTSEDVALQLIQGAKKVSFKAQKN